MVEEAAAVLRDDRCCVVIGLQSTGEAASERSSTEADAETNEFVSPTRDMLQRFLMQHFPIHSLNTPAATAFAGTHNAISARIKNDDTDDSGVKSE